MFWRTSLRSVVAVAVAALVLALNGAGVLEGPLVSGANGLSHGLISVLAALRGSVDNIVSAEPIPVAAGPAYLLVVTGDGIMALDREGYIASFDSACSRADLPALTGFLPATRNVGGRVSSAEVVIGLEIMRTFEDRPDLLKTLSEVNLGDLRNPTAVLAGGVAVSLGKGDYGNKVDKLDLVLANLKQLGMQARNIDLRFNRQAVVTCVQPKHDEPKQKDLRQNEPKRSEPKQAEPKRSEPKRQQQKQKAQKHSEPKHNGKKGV